MKNINIILLLYFILVVHLEEIPLSYPYENTGKDCKIPELLDPSLLKRINLLPNPFEWSDSSGKVTLETVNKGLTGLEFAAGIPGTVGGCIYGNAGAYNACIMDYVESVTVIDEDFNINIIKHEDIEYGYRTTMFKEQKKYVIVAAKFYLKIGDKANSLEMIKERQDRRAATQPIEYPSAGSVFRNPDGDYAGRLIEFCGLKGARIGGAEVSEKHANFVINKENASSKDVHDLICYIHDTVLNKTNVDLEIEQEFIGWE